MPTRPWHVPVRLATGLVILNEGLSKQDADDETATRLKNQAAIAFPRLGELEPQQFAAVLSATETALGTALLAMPFVPPLVAGLGLLGFSAGLNRLYLKVPGARQEGSVRPTRQGIPLVKDVWMTGIGAALVLDALLAPKRRRRR